jgi:hypothetical protein
MTQRLFKRLDELEKAALRVQRGKLSLADTQALRALEARVDAMRTDPAIQKRIAELPPDFLHKRMRDFRYFLTTGQFPSGVSA